MGSRTVLYTTLFVAIAGIAGIFARAYFNEQDATAAVIAEPKPMGPKVIFASRDLAVGAFLTAEDVRWQATSSEDEVILTQHFVEGAATLESMVGAVVRRPTAGEKPLTAANIIKPGQRGFLAAVLRPGMRAVTVEIDKVSGNSGLVFPGDYVDLILTVELADPEIRNKKRHASETILANVRVIAMGERVESFATVEAEEEKRPATTATLEVAPQHAERVNVAQRLGGLALSLRSLAEETPGEEQVIGGVAPEITKETLKANTTWASDISAAMRLQEQQFEKAKPKPAPRPAARSGGRAKPKKKTPTLTVMRGGERTVLQGKE